ncbi:sigma-70 family RNA polymerase sigma factor [Spirosoma aureum]|uniref:Sigma-70 family RNA polymerase sigma factor n=1 Tax=Spirosoma aureum TaxID=2692134 RepID=A0A6G9ARU9_9BACT|nr:sigma-70 family RNA polymerase sigma factor [Spirosoma aureum]QIP15049.1 sigma-70 family RNA polymerase sigma factor [Spirosoma aureum]
MAQSSTSLVEEQELWHRFRHGDEEAFSILANRHYRKLLHYGQKFSSNTQFVEDALQELLIHLWLHRATLNDTPSVTFYLLKAFRHQLIKALKRRAYEQLLDGQADAISFDFSIEQNYIQQETHNLLERTVEAALAQLPARQKEVIYLRYYQGLRPEEIASLLDIKPQSVSNILQRALTRLRENWPSILLIGLLFLYK